MVIAGPVFPEWYWGPIFFLVFFGPLVAGLTTAIYLVVRRRGRSGPVVAVACFVVSAVAVLLGGAIWRSAKFELEARADSRGLDFVTLLPRGYHAQSLRPIVADHVRALWATYDGPLYVEEEQAGPVDASDPAGCRIMIAGPLATHPALLGPCRRARTPRGGEVLLDEDVRESAVYAVRQGTLIKVRGPQAAALALIDALEPVAPEDIDFTR
jgi:hypothetical protein